MSEIPTDLFPEIQSTGAVVDLTAYQAECAMRWYGPALTDAKHNWHAWRKLHVLLDRAMVRYRDQSLSLSQYLWALQTEVQPDRSCFNPFLDFEERYQSVFLCRGLVIYCKLILAAQEIKPAS